MEYLKEKIKVLYVDDEVANLSAFKAEFRRDFVIYTAQSSVEGMKILINEGIHIVISDQRMPEVSGNQFLCLVKQEYPKTIRMIMTAYSDVNVVIEAVNECEIYRFLQKPWDKSYVRKSIEQAYEVYSLRDQNNKLMTHIGNIDSKLDVLLDQNNFEVTLTRKVTKKSVIRRGFDELIGFITKKDK